MKHQFLTLVGIVGALTVSDCTHFCTMMVLCPDTIELKFDPPVQAGDAVAITVSGDDTNLTGYYSRRSAMGPITLWPQVVDGGGFIVTSASIGNVTPRHISYVVVADGITVASGEVDLQYEHYTRGGEDCTQHCNTAYVTVPASQ